MEYEFKTKNRVVANLIKSIIKNSSGREIMDKLDELNPAHHVGSGINFLAEIYGFDNGDEGSTFDIYIAVHKVSSENDIEKITFFDAENIFDAARIVCADYDASSMGITNVELILSYLDEFQIEDVSSCLGWAIDDDVQEDDNYVFVKRDSSSKEWVRCEESEARYKIAL